MIKLKSLLLKEIIYDTNVWYHGSPSGDLRGGKTGLHLGTYKAAKQALEARIGVPVEGEWDGTREYGKTLLCGKNTLYDKDHYNICPSGFSCDVPNEDFYVKYHPELFTLLTYSNGSKIPLLVKPSIKAYKILCPMTNHISKPYEDDKANGYMKSSLKRGNAKRGFYYTNMSEDEGSISVVVPNGNCVKEI